jgi:hypothetical protein
LVRPREGNNSSPAAFYYLQDGNKIKRSSNLEWAGILSMQSHQYFVWRRPSLPASFRVVRREVKDRTLKGTPISFALKAIPGEFDDWETAQQVADRLNRKSSLCVSEEWVEDDRQIY